MDYYGKLYITFGNIFGNASIRVCLIMPGDIGHFSSREPMTVSHSSSFSLPTTIEVPLTGDHFTSMSTSPPVTVSPAIKFMMVIIYYVQLFAHGRKRKHIAHYTIVNS